MELLAARSLSVIRSHEEDRAYYMNEYDGRIIVLNVSSAVI